MTAREGRQARVDAVARERRASAVMRVTIRVLAVLLWVGGVGLALLVGRLTGDAATAAVLGLVCGVITGAIATQMWISTW